ncbi:MAG: hypothetical protein M3R36_09775 [Bacteroidota bacterium]|nr:hypothetical protein [Bacteroidota bacterium]
MSKRSKRNIFRKFIEDIRMQKKNRSKKYLMSFVMFVVIIENMNKNIESLSIKEIKSNKKRAGPKRSIIQQK